jgi:hypothetical protein
MSKIIPLTRGKEAIVDDEDFEHLNQWKWGLDTDGYAIRGIHIPRRKTFIMHREIMKTPKGMETDHINGNKLDNRKCNLRICTKSQNKMNISRQVDNMSGYKGVSRHCADWQAQIGKDGIKIYLGIYKNKELAARAYDEAAKKLFGEYARLNFPEVVQ